MNRLRKLKITLRRLLIDLLIHLLIKQSPTRGTLKPKDYIIAMGKLHQNPGFQQYCDQREDYLIYTTMNLVAKDLLLDAKGITGQLLEVRSLRKMAETCYYKIRKDS